MSRLATTPLAGMQTAWTSVLAQTHYTPPTATGESAGAGKRLDVQFGSVLNGRHDEAARNVMAPMLTTALMRVVLDEEVCSGSSSAPSNKAMCHLLARQHAEVFPYENIPCPTRDMIETQLRFDSLLLLQTHVMDKDTADLPGWNWQDNLLKTHQESDSGFPVQMELWPGHGARDRNMYVKCTYNRKVAGYEFLTPEWVQGLVLAFEEALVRIVEEPDAPFSVAPV